MVMLAIKLLFSSLAVSMTPILLLMSQLPSLPENIELEIKPFLETGFFFIPYDVFVVTAASFIAWYGFRLGWGIFEFVIRKIPGVS